jgi:hypothetical protein
MIIVECAQGGEEWHRARAGCITASMFTTARERLKSGANKGDYSSKAKDYAFRLAIERISGEPLDEGFETWQMKRGHDLETEARMEHEAKTGLFVKRTGFVKTDDGLFGASADGLIADDGGSEYKCFLAPEKLRTIILDRDIGDVREQAQGCMWLTNRKWWHVGLYCPALSAAEKQFTMIEVQRDDDFIGEMEKDLWQFAMLVAQYEKQLRQQAA